MAIRIGLIHAVNVSIPPAQQAFQRLWPEAVCTNLLDDSLTGDHERAGVLTDAMRRRFQILADYVIGTGAAGILFTCSAFGEAIAAVAATAKIPVLKPNEAMFEAALDAGRRIGMLAVFAPAVAPMEQEFAEMAAKRGSPAELETFCVAGAMAALKAGDAATHNRLFAEAALRFRDHDAVLLAHFSSSQAASDVERALGRPPLTSPTSAVLNLKRRILGG
jgi:Asp/Glu/hydantoin racemase